MTTAANTQKSNTLNLLIVDDEANIRKTLSYCLTGEGHAVTAVSNTADAIAEARRRSFDIAYVDLRLGNEDGMALIPALISDSPWIKIIVITAYASIESAVKAIQCGATDFIAKPFSPDQIRILNRRIAQIRSLETQVEVLKEDLQRLGPKERLQSQNPGMQRVIEIAKKAAKSEATILIYGESGTGKSVFARAIHQLSPRSGKPLSVVSCPAVPHDLLESELFGHTAGAFTGAFKEAPGRIAFSEGGTLFLDEIGDMAFPVQAKLLRFIQDKEYERLGDPRPRTADVRIIAATNADLAERVAEGKFREDLFYRLNVITLTVPPLRERAEDIMPLAMDFLAHFCKVNRKRLLGYTHDAELALKQHSWPGNVRELRNAVERAVILGYGPKVRVLDLPESLTPSGKTPAIGDPISLEAIEELHIRRVIAGSPSLQEAAEILGIDQATLWRKRKIYGV